MGENETREVIFMWKKATVLALALVFVLGLTAQAVMEVARTRYTDNSVDEHSRTGHQYTLGGRTRAASVEAVSYTHLTLPTKA